MQMVLAATLHEKGYDEKMLESARPGGCEGRDWCDCSRNGGGLPASLNNERYNDSVGCEHSK